MAVAFGINWLEGLAVEWLALDGFAIIPPPPVPTPNGGRRFPDLVGVKNVAGGSTIRHCEMGATAPSVQKLAAQYADKFAPNVRSAVKAEVRRVVRVNPDSYEMWVVLYGFKGD